MNLCFELNSNVAQNFVKSACVSALSSNSIKSGMNHEFSRKINAIASELSQNAVSGQTCFALLLTMTSR